MHKTLFVYEYTCCQPSIKGTAKQSLHSEGLMMLSAILQDFRQVPQVQLRTMLAEDCPFLAPCECHRITPREEEPLFRQLAGSADFSLVIAPEFDGLLYQRCCWVLEAGGQLLGPAPEEVRLTGDKLLLAQHLTGHGLPTPPTVQLTDVHHSAFANCPLVCKPRFGAGSQNTYLVTTWEELENLLTLQHLEEHLVQPFVPGLSASVAFLIGPRQRLALVPTRQKLSEEGRFHYLGGEAPLPPELAARAERLARAALESLTTLCGYVGVDLVLGEAPDGSQDWIIEINPRLTTSYVGLRQLAKVNLAEVLWQVMRGLEPPPIRWRRGPVVWEIGQEVRVASELDGDGCSPR